MSEITCQFSEPVNLGTEELPDFEYSEIVCNNSQYEYIQNETTEASFYIDKSYTYGDFYIMFFLMIFTLYKIVEIIWNKFIKK